MRKLNQKQELFCQFFVQCGSGAEAMRKAGYAKKNAGGNADRLLKIEGVQKRIKELNEGIENDNICTAIEIQERLSSIIRLKLQEEVVVTEGIGNGCTEARMVKKTASFKDVIGAIDKLARIKGLYNDKVTIDNKPVIIFGSDNLED